MAAVKHVLIMGGGIAGMTLAIALERSGIRVEIVELSPDWSVLGVGISLQGPALRALRMVGVLDACVGQGFGYSHFNACNAAGEVTGTVQLPRLNGPGYPSAIGIMRQAVHTVLQAAVAKAHVPVRLGTTIAALDQHDDGVAMRFADGSHGSYDLVVGADGANSKVRHLVFGGASPQYTGQAVWRATVRRPPEVQGRYSFFGPRNKAGFNPVSDAGMYVYLVQNLPEFVRLADDRLPEVMREQLADFGGLVAAARNEIVDPRHIVYRPITSYLLPAPWHRDTWPPAPASQSRTRSCSPSSCNRNRRCPSRWRRSRHAVTRAAGWWSRTPSSSANGRRTRTRPKPIRSACSTHRSRRSRSRFDRNRPLRRNMMTTIDLSTKIQRARAQRDENWVDLIVICAWSIAGLALTGLSVALSFGAEIGQALAAAG
jgi:2-polyprenyl-6-methoxyphenol hydroxylase-like FAD-dependent oxidoreductase